MGGSVGGGIVRGLTAVVTGGTSELLRKKPFQPGGEGKETDRTLRSLKAASPVGLVSELSRSKPYQSAPDRNDKGNVLGFIAPGIDVAKKTGLLPAPPPLDTSAIDIANKAKEAANAVQTADAEGRRARNAKRQSSVLGSYQAKSSINAATLQPAQPRRSVLG